MKNTQTYKSQGKKTLFDDHFSSDKLAEIGNPLDMIGKVIDFESFRALLESKLLNSNKKTMQEQNHMMLS